MSPTLCPHACHEPSRTSKARSATPAIVLDTNVVLAWLLFRDPSSKALAAAIEQRRVRWVASPSMRVELTEVLQRGLAAARNTDSAAVLASWDCFAELHDEPPRLAGKPALQCADPDDQVFLDLAWATSARWLVSRDRALLRLARRAAVFDLAVTAPEHWSAPE